MPILSKRFDILTFLNFSEDWGFFLIFFFSLGFFLLSDQEPKELTIWLGLTLESDKIKWTTKTYFKKYVCSNQMSCTCVLMHKVNFFAARVPCFSERTDYEVLGSSLWTSVLCTPFWCDTMFQREHPMQSLVKKTRCFESVCLCGNEENEEIAGQNLTKWQLVKHGVIPSRHSGHWWLHWQCILCVRTN